MVNLKIGYSGSYICKNCNSAFVAPSHCGKFMNYEEDNTWVCWKGEHEPCCGKESKLEIENCCDSPSLVPSIE